MLMESLIEALRAASEPTRLRILAALASCELTVGELCRVLGQSQPRVSRHLGLLCDAGVLRRNPQGSSAYFRPARSGTGREVFEAVIGLIDDEDEIRQGDLRRLGEIRAERARDAAEYFESIANDWSSMRDLHVSDSEVELAMLDAVADLDVHDLLDVGTGTGRVLEIFADRIEHGVGVDLSNKMLNLARSRLDQLGLANCAVRQANAYDLGLHTGSIDVAVLHHVLHFLDDPRSSIIEVARTLRPNGRVVIVDFASHDFDTMRTDYAHRWLGFSDSEVDDWCQEAGLIDVAHTHLTPRDRDGEEPLLTVTMWVATQRSNAPAIYPIERSEAAS